MLKINVFWEMKRERVFLQNVEKTLLIHTNLRQYTIHLTVPSAPDLFIIADFVEIGKGKFIKIYKKKIQFKKVLL